MNKTMATPLVQQPEQALAVVQQALAPLVRLMLTHGVMLPAAVQMLKQLYVQGAVDELLAIDETAAPTDSRVSIVTGVHRKDVKRLRGNAALAGSPPAVLSVSSTVVTRWISDRQFTKKKGVPKPLARSPRIGSPNFTELVALVSVDVRARAVLDELTRLGVVKEDADGFVHLQTSAFVPPRGTNEKFHYFAKNAHDHLAAAAHNMLNGGAPMLEQSVFADKLSAADAQQLSDKARDLWKRLLDDFIVLAQRAEDRCDVPLAERYRINFGTYCFTEPLQPNSARKPATGET